MVDDPHEATPPYDFRYLEYVKSNKNYVVTYCKLLSPPLKRSPPVTVMTPYELIAKYKYKVKNVREGM